MALTMLMGTGFPTDLMMDETNPGEIQLYGGCALEEGYYSGKMVRLSAYSQGRVKLFLPLPQDKNEIYLSAWVKCTAVDKDYWDKCFDFTFHLNDGSTVSFYTRNTTLAWDAFVGSSGTPVATGSTNVHNKWHSFQAHVKIDDTNGLVELKIDGNAELSWEGDTQQNATANPITSIECGWAWHSGDPQLAYLDSIAIFSGDTWPGDVRFDQLRPNADTAQKDWSKSDAGATYNYEVIDELDFDDEYVYADGNQDRDLYDLDAWDEEDPDGEPKTPLALVHWVRAIENEGSSGDQQIKLLLKPGGTVYAGDSQDLNAHWRIIKRIDMTNPATGQAWTNAAIDDLEAGQEAVI